jgi:hypothetical protein
MSSKRIRDKHSFPYGVSDLEVMKICESVNTFNKIINMIALQIKFMGTYSFQNLEIPINCQWKDCEQDCEEEIEGNLGISPKFLIRRRNCRKLECFP